jgi:signal transduction histidine kinase
VNLLARDGSILAAEMRATRVTWNGAAGWLILIRDVTEVLRSKREIQQLNENLATQVRDLEQFTYSLAHDLRSPVRAVLGFLELLREDRGSALSPNALQLLEKVRNRTSFMDELICGMLDFARSSLQPLAMKRVDLNEVVESVIGRMSESAPQVREIVRSGLLPTVDGDPLLLTQVFTNLISNGVKYSSASEQPVVLVYQMPCEDCYHIAVADNGIGFPPEKASSLFNVFTRLQPNHSEGVGVGLAIVRNIVVRHGGRIWAEGTPGEGARFHIELPKGAPEKLPAATSTSGTG